MRRVAEIMYIIPEERETFISDSVNPDEETRKMLWMCGVRNQQYFGMNDLIFMTFEYDGHHFDRDMAAMAAFLASRGHLVAKRRRDIAPEARQTTNWWAPVKKLGSVLPEAPASVGEEDLTWDEMYRAMVGGSMSMADADTDTAFDEDDWTESIHI